MPTSQPAAKIEEIAFSMKAQVFALCVSGFVVLLAISSGASRTETAGVRIVAVACVVSTALLLLRNRYSLYAWAFSAALVALGSFLFDEVGPKRLLGSISHYSLVCWLAWMAYRLFRSGHQLASVEHCDSKPPEIRNS